MVSMRRTLAVCAVLLLVISGSTGASPALKDAVVLIIRHAEKPDSGYALSPAGEHRAQAYVHYFQNFTLDSLPLKLDELFAAADSKNSHRPRLTLEPLAAALEMKLNTTFEDKNPRALAA